MKAFRSFRLQQQITLFRFGPEEAAPSASGNAGMQHAAAEAQCRDISAGRIDRFSAENADHWRKPAGAVSARPLCADLSARSRAHHRFDRLRLSGRRSRSAALRPDPHWCIHRSRSAKAPPAARPGRAGRSGIRSAGGRRSAFSAKLYGQPPLYGAGLLQFPEHSFQCRADLRARW